MPYHRALHTFAVFTACATFLLIAAGALVTSNDAGLSVPDWPTSFGHSPITYQYFEVPMVGGVKYEHGHRIFAEFIGILTIILALWAWRADRRPAMRWLGIAAIATVVLQGVLGGLTVLHGLPAVVSTAHAALGQAFFCIAVCIAVLTGRNWLRQDTRVEPEDIPSRPLRVHAWTCVAVIYVQLILGAMFRHHGMRLLPHLITAAILTLLLFRTVLLTLAKHIEEMSLRRPAILLLCLLVLQLALGFAAYLTRVIWSQGAASVPSSALIVSTVAHVSIGALLLATAVVLAVNMTRYGPAARVPFITGNQKAATA
jgi:cytochrome c oxidase assembly protein subunit 15